MGRAVAAIRGQSGKGYTAGLWAARQRRAQVICHSECMLLFIPTRWEFNSDETASSDVPCSARRGDSEFQVYTHVQESLFSFWLRFLFEGVWRRADVQVQCVPMRTVVLFPADIQWKAPHLSHHISLNGFCLTQRQQGELGILTENWTREISLQP